MKSIKIILSLFLCLSVGLGSLCCFAKTVSSESDISDVDTPVVTEPFSTEMGTNLNIKAKSAVLLDSDSGEILYEQNASEITPPASITKIMSLILIMEAIDEKRLNLNEVVTASEHASSMGGSQIWLKENESMTVDDLLKATVIASANDATVALAEKVAGSEEEFVRLMNKKAKELGMRNTTFENATGLDCENHLTTAYDVALMSSELIHKHPLIKKYSTVWMDSLRNGESELVNTNKLVRFYKGTTGLKTGTTSTAGYCLSATASKDGLNLVAVVMNGESSAERFSGAKKMLDYGFANYKRVKVTPEKTVKKVKVKDGVKEYVKVKYGKEKSFLLRKTDTLGLSQKLNIKKEITAPVKKGEKIGSVDIYMGDTQIGAIDITAKTAVKKRTFLHTFASLIKGLFEI